MCAFRALVLAVAMLGAASSMAADAVVIGPVIGQVTGVRGEVFRESADRREPAIVGTELRPGDVLASHNGKAKVRLNDGTVLSVGEHSRLDIRDFRGADNNFTTRLNASTGVFRLLVKSLPEGGFIVETEIAVASVRGTDWLLVAEPDLTAVFCQEGSVEVTGQSNMFNTALLRAGQGTDVRRGAGPTAPAAWREERLARTLARANFD